MKFTKNVVAYFVVGSLTLTSCQTANPYTGESQQAKATTGAIIGGLFGAGIGALSGGSNTERKQRALLGAGVGISRNGNQITLVMPGDITFSTGSSGIVGQFYPTLASVAKVLNKYNRTMVAITGHTDNVGARDYNYRLSEARANSVAQFLQTQAVASQRFQVSGRGMDQPIADNNTASGRQANRRVSIQLAPLN